MTKKYLPVNNNLSREVLSVAAFLVPNEQQHIDDNFESYLVKIEQLEALVGFELFEGLLTSADKVVLDDVIPHHRDLTVLLSADVDKLRTNKEHLELALSPAAALQGTDVGHSKLRHLCASIQCSSHSWRASSNSDSRKVV
jgi:hypothetical protein